MKKNFLFLAPMAGYTNGACRSIFREYGADGVVSEFVYCRAVLNGAARVLDKMRIEESQRPVGIQIFGSDPSEMSDAAVRVKEMLAPDFIDVNFGCPAPNAVAAGAGSALLKEPKKMAQIISAMSAALGDTPVTAKMRTGWNNSSIIVPDAAQMLQDAGAQMLTLHGRTKSQGYEGDSNWELIEATAKALQIPVIGNGSVEKLTAGQLRDSACTGFMIGRAALGNPWIFSQVKARMNSPESVCAEPTPKERAQLAYRFAELIANGDYTGITRENLTHAKSQIMRFLRDAAGFKKLRAAIKDVNTLDDLKKLLCEYI